MTIIRHDIDHDIEAAVSIGRWEAEHGLRSTFCILHSAWYYGVLEKGSYLHSTEMVEAAQELERLGHEVNFHNNIVTEALLHGFDPAELLAGELEFLRSHGLIIERTSGHGHSLCGELGYFNLELFSETTWPDKGGPRTISYEGNEVHLGQHSMQDFDLSYEAYDIVRDLYLTDSGGRPRMVKNTRGRSGLRAAQAPERPRHGEVVGILTHSIYWGMSTPGFPSFKVLEKEYEERRARRRAAP